MHATPKHQVNTRLAPMVLAAHDPSAPATRLADTVER